MRESFLSTLNKRQGYANFFIQFFTQSPRLSLIFTFLSSCLGTFTVKIGGKDNKQEIHRWVNYVGV